MTTTPTVTEADILADVIGPGDGNLPADVANAVLQWKFTDHATQHMNTLCDRNNAGTITDAERDVLERYLRVGSMINLIQAKARLLRRLELDLDFYTGCE